MFIEDSLALFVGEPGVHDRVVPGLDDHPHGFIRAAVRHYPAVAPMSFLRDRRQLLVRERRTEGVGPKRAPARCHHLEEVSTLLDELTSGMPDAIRTIGLGTHEPAMAAANRYRATRCKNPRPTNHTLLNAFLETEGGLVPAPTVADSCHPRIKGPPHVVCRAQQADGVVVTQVDVFTAPSIAGHIRMRVAIDQTWQERCVGEVEDVLVRRPALGAGPTDVIDLPTILTTISVAAAAPVPSRTLPARMVIDPSGCCMVAPRFLCKRR